jgi:hypothetical protein
VVVKGFAFVDALPASFADSLQLRAAASDQDSAASGASLRRRQTLPAQVQESRRMWCQHCHQSTETADDEPLELRHCAYCGARLGNGQARRKPARRVARHQRMAAVAPMAMATEPRPWSDGEFWAHAQELRDIASRVAAFRPAEKSVPAASPAVATIATHAPALSKYDAVQAAPAAAWRRAVRMLSAAATGLGLMAACGGAALLVLGKATGREELVRIGLPSSGAGLLALVVGWLARVVASESETPRRPAPSAAIDTPPPAVESATDDDLLANTDPWIEEADELFGDVDEAVALATAGSPQA